MQQRCLMQSRRIVLQRSAAPHSAPQQLRPLVLQCSRLAQSTPQQQQATAHSSDGVQLQRRQVVLTGVLMVLSMASPAMAEDGATERQLPKAYRTVVEKIIKSLREALEAEVDGSNEYEIRRKADPAKSSVRDFVGKWRDDVRVTWHPSHVEIEGVITELGNFYQREGPRARLSSDVRQSISQHLDAAERALGAKSSTSGETGLEGLFPGA